MDRLARNLDDLRRLVFDLTKMGVHVRFVKENLRRLTHGQLAALLTGSRG
jgi:DNA invertase Pin-like site-specific DNA recombinase